MSEPAKIVYVGRSDRGTDITGVVAPGGGHGIVPDHPVYGDARRESRRRMREGKAKAKGSKTPLQRKGKRQ